MAETGPIVELTDFPIVARELPSGQPAHSTRSTAICQAISGALSLPAGVSIDDHANYATLSTVGLPNRGDEVEFRVRINGFSFGKGSKKTIEYLSVSFVGLDASSAVVTWSEDLQGFRGTTAYWDAIHAGKPPPKLKANPRDCALLTFIDADGQPMPMTDELRAAVSRVAAPPAPKAKPAKKKSG
ncbi:MAG: hypothetical protein HY791_34305 [Deltaproteobacteria bacterium]|nr:hypothetical protein [Deltaproteobacteria bacterium]